MMDERIYLLLCSQEIPLARGMLVSSPGTETIQLRVLDGRVEEVTAHEVIQLISVNAGELPLLCHLVQHKDDQVTLKRMGTLNPELRRSLRIPVRFDSFLYPLSGQWKGRRSVRSVDLSCGGVAFYTSCGLENGERAEIVIPITTEPLIMQIQILRQQALKHDRAYYAAKFVNMCKDEEEMICEAVFSIQQQKRSQTAGLEEMEDETR